MRFAFAVGRRALVWAAIGCVVSISARAQADELLRWSLKAGDSFDYEIKQDMVMNIDAGQDRQLSINSDQTMNITWNVKSVDDKGVAQIEQKIDRIQKKMSAPGGQGFAYDTDSKEPAVGMAAMVAPTLEAMTTGNVTFNMSPRGEVSDVKISDPLLAVVKNGPGGETGAVDQFKSIVSQVAFVLPENPPKTGETWTTKIGAGDASGGSPTLETIYTYDGTREADGTTYAVIKPNMKMDVAKVPMMEMKMKDQKTDGEALFDLEAGELHSVSVNQNITMDMIAGGQAMPGTIDQNIEVTLTPAKEKPATTKPEPKPATK
jgi:Family of unknown function (DUF6263)